MEVPPDMLGMFSELHKNMKALTLMVLAECHDPDYQVMQKRVRELFNNWEAETFQLKLFED